MTRNDKGIYKSILNLIDPKDFLIDPDVGGLCTEEEDGSGIEKASYLGWWNTKLTRAQLLKGVKDGIYYKKAVEDLLDGGTNANTKTAQDIDKDNRKINGAPRERFKNDNQFIFYTFNNYAGYARFLHTGQFMIDLRFMIEQYFRFRMESISRAANVNLNDFMQFIQSVIIDDPAAPVYGIDDFYEKTLDRNTNQTQTTARFDAVRLQTEISERLRNITPDGTFKQPTIELYIESVPRKNFNPSSGVESLDNSKTILRIHVYDKQASQYEGLGNILEIARDNTLSAFSTITTNTTNQSSRIGQAQKQQIEQIINSAVRNGLIERIDPSRRELNPDGRYTYYKFVGSQGKRT
jgi:hypothetical protein